MTVDEPQPEPPASPTIDWVLDQLQGAYGLPVQSGRLAPIDELVATILSQNTSDVNTARAFQSLKDRFPTWEGVVEATDTDIADAIRVGGLADTKAPRIRKALIDIRERRGSFDLSFLTSLSVAEARQWLTSLDGVGPKTASCVLLFSLEMPAMPVDTHVFRVTRRLGLIPERATADRAHELLEAIIPDGETYAAHMLFIRHGRVTCVARKPRCHACVLVQCCPTARTIGFDEQG